MLITSGMADKLFSHTKKIMWSMVEYKELQMMYTCALKEIQTKFEVLNTEFNIRHKRNPINSIHTRLKRAESIMEKLRKNHLPITLSSVEENVHDVAGIRVICSYIDDIYSIADALLKQDDICLIARKDYIETPKPNGYRSLHLIVSIPVFFEEKKKNVKVEVQIRTIAMDFWASLEHQIKYKQEIPDQQSVCTQLKSCADVIAETDQKMLALRRQIEQAEDAPTEEEILLERMSRLDIPIG
ncbi:MAG: GTP pyrophosphokinase family protein [Clostridia bacterium]|nr:GTP pyrophosphokinase family protein [Clostridia bacterium]